jgi:ArsR family transcriptional regulator
MLGHPVRTRHPAMLRRSGIATSTRDGSSVVHEPAGGDAADLMRAARRIPTEMPARRGALPAEPREAEVVAR